MLILSINFSAQDGKGLSNELTSFQSMDDRRNINNVRNLKISLYKVSIFKRKFFPKF